MHDALFLDHLERHHRDRSRAEVEKTYYARPDKAANILAPVEAQCQWLREIGYTDVDCYLKVFELAVFGGASRPARLSACQEANSVAASARASEPRP